MQNENIKAKIIADSITAKNCRMTTFVLEFPRIVLAELNTHRMLSKNSASCISGDTIITVEKSSSLKKGSRMKHSKITIKEIVDKWFDGDSMGRSMRSRLKRMNLRCLNEDTGEYTTTRIENCFRSGIKPIYEVELENGYKIKCTKEHRIFGSNGWFTLNDINIKERSFGISWDNDSPLVATNGESPRSRGNSLVLKYFKIKNIKYAGEEETYDLEVLGPYHNFVANGIVVHNSRAIPFNSMVDSVLNNPFIPTRFQKDHKGMQGVEYYEGEEHEQCITDWLIARDMAVQSARRFKLPVTKQLRNRILEPFLNHKVILSGTEFENFFALRAHKDAEIHIQELAYKMLEEYNKSSPKYLRVGEWHIPFGDQFDQERLQKVSIKNGYTQTIDAMLRITIARCARISYNNFEGQDDYEKDIQLCERLFGSVPRHLSPTEHVAIAEDHDNFIGNLKGFKQYRKFFEDENAKEPRVKK